MISIILAVIAILFVSITTILMITSRDYFLKKGLTKRKEAPRGLILPLI